MKGSENMKDIINALTKKKSFGEVSVTEFAPPDQWAEKIARDHLGKDMKTTQLRKVFTAIKQMEQKVKILKEDASFNDPSLFMLVPQMAYAKARGLIKNEFYEMIKSIIGDGKTGKIQTVKDFKRFSEFMTAIVAYHKFHNSK